MGVTRISFPAISTGVYRFPIEDAAKIAIAEAQNWPDLDIVYVLYSDQALQQFDQADLSRAGAPSGLASFPGTSAG